MSHLPDPRNLTEGVLTATRFSSAGRIDLPWLWSVLALHATMLLAGVPFLALPMHLGHLVVAGLDVGRFGWSAPSPSPCRP